MSKFIIQDCTGMYFVMDGVWSFVAADAHQFSSRQLALQCACLTVGARVLTINESGKVLYAAEPLLSAGDFISHIAHDPLAIIVIAAFVLFTILGFAPQATPAASQRRASVRNTAVRGQAAGFDASWLLEPVDSSTK